MIPLILTVALVGSSMPQIPFEVTDNALGRTVYVKSSCAVDKHTLVLLASDITPLDNELKAALMHAFRTDGITIINVCRTGAR